MKAIIPTFLVFATARFIDVAIQLKENGIQRIVDAVLWILLIMLLNLVIDFISSFLSKSFELKMETYISEQLLKKCDSLEYYHFEAEKDQMLIKRVFKDASKNFTEGYGRILQAVELAIRIISLIFVIQVYVWWAGLAVILIAIPLFIMAFRNGEEDYEAFEEAEEYRRYADYYSEVISGREYSMERLLFSWFPWMEKKWKNKYEKSRKTEFSAQVKIFMRTTGAGIATATMSLIVAAVLLPAVLGEQISPGTYISLVISSLNLIKQLTWELTVLMQDLTRDRLYLDDFNQFCSLSEWREINPNHTLDNGFQIRQIEFDNVSFSYPGSSVKIIDGLSFILEQGKQYALVGENAAGKTTIVKLLSGLYDQYSGEIRINGKELREYSSLEKQELFSIVYQDFAKYQMTIEENICVGRSGNLNQSLTWAGVKDMIQKLPQKEKTKLGKFTEKDVWLSGGEWQRIALARGFYKDAPIQILDEPTAAIDPIQEAEFFRLFQRHSIENSIGILITHRLGGAHQADEILVLNEGRVTEQGTPEELIRKMGEYYAMYEKQKSWYTK